MAGTDTVLLWIASGDPLYRLHVSLKGVHGDNPTMAAAFATPPGFGRFGSIAAPRWLQAPLILFASQNYGFVFWAAVPATIALATGRTDPDIRRATRLLGLLALVWFVVLSYAFLFLWLVPRYQIVTASALVGPLALWLVRVAGRRRRLSAALIVVTLLCTDVGLIALSDRQPLWGERTLVAYVASHPGLLFTDPGTLVGAEWLLQIGGLSGRVRATPPPPGTLYFFNSIPHRGIPAGWPLLRPLGSWVAVARFAQHPGPGARWSACSGCARCCQGRC